MVAAVVWWRGLQIGTKNEMIAIDSKFRNNRLNI